MEARRCVRLPNAAGLHARPCSAIARTALGFESELVVECGGRAVNGKSILELMTLSAPQATVLSLAARGRDAAELVRAIAELVESGFGEQP